MWSLVFKMAVDCVTRASTHFGGKDVIGKMDFFFCVVILFSPSLTLIQTLFFLPLFRLVKMCRVSTRRPKRWIFGPCRFLNVGGRINCCENGDC